MNEGGQPAHRDAIQPQVEIGVPAVQATSSSGYHTPGYGAKLIICRTN